MSPLGASRFIPRGPYGIAPVEEPPPEPGESTFDLRINTSFNPDAPVLKNGTVLTGEALSLWQGLKWLIENHASRGTMDGDPLLDLIQENDLYKYSRDLGVIYAELLVLFRLTGWAKILDEITRIATLHSDELGTWTGYDANAVNWPRHNYLCWVWDQSGAPLYRGTDYHLLDTIRTHEAIAQVAYALRLNEGEVSPAGHDYQVKADFWENYLRDYVDIWRGPEKALGTARNGSSASGWSDNYEGLAHNYYYSLNSGRRAKSGFWPITSRHLTHTHIGASCFHVWLGLAIPEFADAVPVGLHGIEELFFNRNMFYYTGAYGEQGVWPRGLMNTGHYTYANPNNNYPQPSSYIRYVVHSLFNLWLEGLLPRFVEDFAVPVVRSANQYCFAGLSSSQGLAASLLGMVDLAPTAAKLRNGQAMDFTDVGTGGGGTQIRNNVFLMHTALTWLMPWDTDDDVMEKHVWGGFTSGNYGRMGSSTAFYNSSGTPVSRPRVVSSSLGLMLKRAGAKDWEI